mmetsp:Transcript_14262/g.44380  ORF Transcript_14262/g.44380 Transcript_14262/m.44380 type:complete len:198 (-) Transcript_14262:72-665(-)
MAEPAEAGGGKSADGPSEAGSPRQGATEIEDGFLPMDPEVRLFESTNDLYVRLAERCKFQRRKGPPDFVTLADVEGEMDELKMEKDLDESVLADIKRSLEDLTKNTVMPREAGDKKDRRLTAARICQIENRLSTDPSLSVDDEFDGSKYPIYIPDNAAALVKRSLIRTYGKIKKSSYDLSQVTLHQLEERIQVLKKV